MEPMKQSQPFCEKCTKPMTFALPPGGRRRRAWQCLDCEGPDPLKSTDVMGWIKGLLGDSPEESA